MYDFRFMSNKLINQTSKWGALEKSMIEVYPLRYQEPAKKVMSFLNMPIGISEM
jgi:hypothetical protein